MTRVHIEYAVVGGISSIVLALLLNALLYARTAIRDDLRRTDMANLRRAAEMYHNQHAFYPTPPDDKAGCTGTDDASSWLFGNESPLLKEQHIDAIPHDVREGRGHVYRYCVTAMTNTAASGYYFEAELEIAEPPTVDRDHDEARNYDYRVLHQDGTVLYRVCGGTESQCAPVAPS